MLGGAIMGLAGAMQGHFIGFIAPENYLSALTFQVWAMLIIGGSGNNRGAILGAVVVWGFWSLSGASLSCCRPGRAPGARRRAADRRDRRGARRVLLVRPRGLLGEENCFALHKRLARDHAARIAEAAGLPRHTQPRYDPRAGRTLWPRRS